MFAYVAHVCLSYIINLENLEILHVCPPRSLSQYLQEIVRARRRGQASTAILYYSKRDIGSNLPGMSDDIRDYCNNDGCLRKAITCSIWFFL